METLSFIRLELTLGYLKSSGPRERVFEPCVHDVHKESGNVSICKDLVQPV